MNTVFEKKNQIKRSAKMRAGRVQVRLFAVLTALVLAGFASACTKTETVRADPSVIEAQREAAALAEKQAASSGDGNLQPEAKSQGKTQSEAEDESGTESGKSAMDMFIGGRTDNSGDASKSGDMADSGDASKSGEAEGAAEEADARDASEGDAAEEGSSGQAAGGDSDSSAEAQTSDGDSDPSAEAQTSDGDSDSSAEAQTSDGDSDPSAEAQTSDGDSDSSAEAQTSKEAAPKQDEEKQDKDKAAEEITFTAVGDNLINEVLYEQAAQRAADEGADKEYDFSPCYAQIAPLIRERDVNWIDIETLMTDTLAPSGYPAFSTPGDSGRALCEAGWNVFSLCSNHTYDQGGNGIAQTLAFWDSMKEEALSGQDSAAEGICCTGLWEYGSEYDIPVLTCRGRKLAFLTYTYGTNGIETPADAPAHVIYSDEEGLMAYQIELAHEQADAVIVSLHWGEEYDHTQSQEQQELAQRVADMGADLIIGGHPHVVQGAEMLTASDGRKVFCAYSLGNFLCAQNSMPDPDAMIGLLLSCTFRFTEEGVTVEDHALVPILSDYGDNYADDHVVLYSDYSEEQALAHGMRSMFGFTQFDYDYVREMLTDVVGTQYLALP